MLKTLVIGAGQGGGKIAVAFQDGPIFALNSTDSDALPELSGEHKIYFSNGGAGQNASVGQQLFAEHYNRIEEQLFARIKDTGQPQVIIVSASLGGGTGSGTLGHLADMLKAQYPDVPVFGVVTLPENAFLNPNSAANVIVAMEILKQAAALDAMIFWDNNKVLARDIPLDTVNKLAWGPIKRFMKYVGYPSTVRTLDTQDFYSLIQRGGSMAVFDTNLPLAMTDPDEIIDQIQKTWGRGFYPSEITENLDFVGGFGFIVAVPEIRQNRERLYHQLNTRLSGMFPQKTIRATGFFMDPELPASQYKVITLLSGLPFPNRRLADIISVAKTKRTIVEMPDLTQDDDLVATLGDNLRVVIPQKRGEDSKLAAFLGGMAKPPARTPMMKKNRI
ncbi:cell division protein FtsZ [Peptococcaceae bacterium CEB3]|nr:cell division protein FtsZ [Peptococcaceae bacterium CEB3]